MRELIQRLSALDNDAASAMKMIAHFDALLAQGAGMTALVRGAAVLSGWPCGLHLPQHSIHARVDPQGRPMKPHADASAIMAWPHQFLDDGSDGVVWLERPPDQAGPSDAVILERLAAGVHLTVERVSPGAITDDAAAMEIIASASSVTARRKAIRRLRLSEAAVVRVVATWPGEDTASQVSAALNSAIGPIRVTVIEDGAALPTTLAGLGPAVPVLDAFRTTEHAASALALASRINPVIVWDEWGVLAEAATLAAALRHPDLEAVAGLAADPQLIDTLEALAISDTIRAAAGVLGLHHSTVQQRQLRVESALGFRLSSPTGKTRALVALAVYRAQLAKNAIPPQN